MDRGPTCNIGWTLRACFECFRLIVLVQEVGGRPWRSSGGYQLMVSEVFGHVWSIESRDHFRTRSWPWSCISSISMTLPASPLPRLPSVAQNCPGARQAAPTSSGGPMVSANSSWRSSACSFIPGSLPMSTQDAFKSLLRVSSSPIVLIPV